jgi:gamma-glutamylcyclotransferase (GGCT)/AIG2-like uncharacterized protein YtfP
MNPDRMRLFVYGVLLGEAAQGAAGQLVRGLDRPIPCIATGHLYAVQDPGGWFPAFVPDPDGGDVHGAMHSVTMAELAAIDLFERVGEDYERRSVQLACGDGVYMAAGAYVWRRETDGLERIEHGRFLQWLEETGRPAYRE